MTSTNLLLVLGIGTVVMLIPIIMQSRWKEIPLWKSVIVTLLLTVTGTVGIYVWFYVENLEWGGRSFFGAVFLVPLVCIFAAKILRINYGVLTDISAPAGCAMLALMKLKCYMDGCCRGIRLYRDEMGVAHFFPSQLVELVNALVLCGILLKLSHSKKQVGRVYGWFFILYGSTRFFLNFFRSGTTPFVWVLPAGNVWGLVSILLGVCWLKKVKAY